MPYAEFGLALYAPDVVPSKTPFKRSCQRLNN